MMWLPPPHPTLEKWHHNYWPAPFFLISGGGRYQQYLIFLMNDEWVHGVLTHWQKSKSHGYYYSYHHAKKTQSNRCVCKNDFCSKVLINVNMVAATVTPSVCHYITAEIHSGVDNLHRVSVILLVAQTAAESGRNFKCTLLMSNGPAIGLMSGIWSSNT